MEKKAQDDAAAKVKEKESEVDCVGWWFLTLSRILIFKVVRSFVFVSRYGEDSTIIQAHFRLRASLTLLALQAPATPTNTAYYNCLARHMHMHISGV